jgi:dienelactone hydrolase
LPQPSGKHPAVLNLHGHWEHGARQPVVQTHCIALARKGYVALAVDSVHLPAESFLIGATSIGLMTFDNIRALDLLQSLPEVDGSRIGCTGASGGGQQTMYLMALDDRITAAVPAVLVSYFRHIMDPSGFPNCICNVAPSLLHDLDEPEICAVFAPRPALYLTVTRDWTRDFPKEEFPEIRSIYELYGAGAAVGCAQWESDHDFSKPMRERMYAFFNRYLMGIDGPAAAAEPQIATESLETLDAQGKPPEGARGIEAVTEWYKARFGFKSVVPKDVAAWDAYRADLRKRIADVLGDVPVRGRLAGTPQAATGGLRLCVQSEAGIQVPALLLRAPGSGRAPVAILIHPAGRKSILGEYQDLVDSLRSHGAAVLIPDVRLTGALVRTWDLDAVLWGRPELGMAVTDLRACLDALASLDDIDADNVVLAGLSEAGVTALAAAALEPRFRAVAAERAGRPYLEGRTSPLVANLLRVGDLPQLVAAVAPRRALLASAQPASFAFAQEAYQALGVAAHLDMRENAPAPPDLANFLLRELGLQ